MANYKVLTMYFSKIRHISHLVPGLFHQKKIKKMRKKMQEQNKI